MNASNIVNNIFSLDSKGFTGVALQVFLYQYNTNQVYRQWVNAIGVKPGNVRSLEEIPFLPISFFKSHDVLSGTADAEIIFTSSGTTQSTPGRHLVKDAALYTRSFTEGFKHFYGQPSDWVIIGLLPSYMERSGSSLVMMVDGLVKQSGHSESGFYLYDFDQLHNVLQKLEAARRKTLLIGVTFALLDFAQQYSMQLSHTVVMETGGMKGRREEMVRQQVHGILKERLGLQVVHSEYGMTELLSQAYSAGDGIFKPVPWMKLMVRDEDDPLYVRQHGRGVANIIDLANVYSCSFIATDDAANVYTAGSFEILGRVDNTDIRGCSLMAF